ncbi:arabinose-proton symporter [Stylonychia lemnae]|uniref:Hexose transporter 1 n=1 Tax=Stylonychia lemnae TaxID=5949 RepID=A0A078A5R9_STYLE|nr:arabinose-proton symporter [Stylonychia lemnae]|eukprot:CDW76109.1 arabinose-proton symporter [Stylonychia lemnae]
MRSTPQQIEQNSDKKKIYKNLNLFIMALAGATGALAVGYHFAIVAGILLYIDKDFPEITLEQKSRFVSFAVLGGTIGAVSAGVITEKIGRKFSIISSSVLLIIGPLLLVFIANVEFYCICRILIGFGMGLNMMASQVFMSESSPNELRGQIGSMYILFCLSGCIFAHLSSLYFEYNLTMMFLMGVIPAIVQTTLIILTQSESPIYIAMHGSQVQVINSLKKFYNTSTQAGQREIMASTAKKETEVSQVKLYKELLTTYKWNLFVANMLHILQQFTGINIIQFYGPQILQDAGFGGDSHRDLLWSMVFLCTVNTISNLIGSIMGKKYGRRQLILMNCIPMGISLLLLVGVMIKNQLASSQDSSTGYFVFFCIGFATQPWTVCAEIFPITATDLGKIIAYSILAISCFITFLFVQRYLPETKDKPIEECVRLVLQARYSGCKQTNESLTSGEGEFDQNKGLLDHKIEGDIQLSTQKTQYSPAEHKL